MSSVNVTLRKPRSLMEEQAYNEDTRHDLKNEVGYENMPELVPCEEAIENDRMTPESETNTETELPQIFVEVLYVNNLLFRDSGLYHGVE